MSTAATPDIRPVSNQKQPETVADLPTGPSQVDCPLHRGRGDHRCYPAALQAMLSQRVHPRWPAQPASLFAGHAAETLSCARRGGASAMIPPVESLEIPVLVDNGAATRTYGQHRGDVHLICAVRRTRLRRRNARAAPSTPSLLSVAQRLRGLRDRGCARRSSAAATLCSRRR
jgi:hypothetical protein